MQSDDHKSDIQVTKSYLPPLRLYHRYLAQIWKSHNLTNNGPLVQQLENQLATYFRVQNCIYVSNGTIALQIAIRSLELHGEIITTPFTYVATANAIMWEHCTPVFVDIQTNSYTIDASRIEKAITKKTCAIMGVHVYGLPCEVEKITKIANKYHLKVIYDAAHAFGTKYKNKSLVSYGDISTLSFHATKLFHTGEGGAIITNNNALAKKIRLYRAFGHIYDKYQTIGINGKNSELHAAMGLSIFPSIPHILSRLRHISALYDSYFIATPFKSLHENKYTQYNHAYYPIIFPKSSQCKRAIRTLQQNHIFPRRYFYPSLNTLSYLNPTSCPLSESVASRVLCLPLFESLSDVAVKRIASFVISSI